MVIWGPDYWRSGQWEPVMVFQWGRTRSKESRQMEADLGPRVMRATEPSCRRGDAREALARAEDGAWQVEGK